MFDPHVPPSLLKLQHWFGKNIGQPYPATMPKECSFYIKPSPFLTSGERLNIYHEQYWWRLCGILRGHFPALTRLFGVEDFDAKFSIPFLLSHRPTHYCLAYLGDTLPTWIDSHYTAPDKPLIHALALFDWAYCEARISPSFHKTFTFPYDLLTFRNSLLLQSVEHYASHPFPSLGEEKRHHFTLLRTPENNIRCIKDKDFQ